MRRVGAIFLFVVHPTTPLDPSNPRTKPVRTQSKGGGGAFRPAYWYIDLKSTGTVGKGQPPSTILGRKRRADVVIECSKCDRITIRSSSYGDLFSVDRDLMDVATGRTFASKIYNSGRVRIRLMEHMY